MKYGLKLLYKWNVLILFFCFSFFGCKMIGYYENNGNTNSLYYEEVLHDGHMTIRIRHFQQIGAVNPFNDFSISLSSIDPKTNENIEIIEIEFDVYNMNNKKIEPKEEILYINNGIVYKYYKYSIFFPENVKQIVCIKYNYNGIFYEYKHEFILKRKRNISSWDAVMGI